jgi:hypothetical protein
MMQKWMQNDENEDPQTELGVEDGGVRKKRRGGNNASKRTTRSSSCTAGSVIDGNICDNDRGGQHRCWKNREEDHQTGETATSAMMMMNLWSFGGTMECLHPETIHLLAADLKADLEMRTLEPGTLSTMEGLHPETIHSLSADLKANLEM